MHSPAVGMNPQVTPGTEPWFGPRFGSAFEPGADPGLRPGLNCGFRPDFAFGPNSRPGLEPGHPPMRLVTSPPLPPKHGQDRPLPGASMPVVAAPEPQMVGPCFMPPPMPPVVPQCQTPPPLQWMGPSRFTTNGHGSGPELGMSEPFKPHLQPPNVTSYSMPNNDEDASDAEDDDDDESPIARLIEELLTLRVEQEKEKLEQQRRLRQEQDHQRDSRRRSWPANVRNY